MAVIYVHEMNTNYTPPREREKIKWEKVVGYSVALGVLAQIAGLVLIDRTISESQVNNNTLAKALVVSQTQNEILTKTLGEYRDSNKLLDKTLTASHVPLLGIQVINVKKDKQYLIDNITYVVTNEGDSVINNIQGKWEMNDAFGKKYDLTEKDFGSVGGYTDYTSDGYPRQPCRRCGLFQSRRYRISDRA